MVVVVPRHHGDELVERPPAARVLMRAAALPRCVGQRREQRERFPAPATKRIERREGVVPQVLPLASPSIGIGSGKHGLVHGDDPATACEEPLLGIAEMTDHFDGRPLKVWPAVRFIGHTGQPTNHQFVCLRLVTKSEVSQKLSIDRPVDA